MSAESAAEGGGVFVADDCISPIERRKHERVSAHLRVRWEGLHGCHDGTASDISIGGCFILTDGRVAQNELLRLEIEFHTGDWVKVWGEVTNWSEGIGFGVRYTEILEEEEAGNYTRAIGHAKALKSAVAALKRLDATVVKKDGSARPASVLGSLAEYNSELMRALPKVNGALAGVPECPKKNSVRLAVQAYVDASRAWAVMSKLPRQGKKSLPELTKLLHKRYAVPPDVAAAMERCEYLPVLNFLWLRGHVHLAFAR